MAKPRAKKRRITAAQRGNIVQRVLVDGWSVEQAAATFDIAERRITHWVSAYRRHGMASLHDDATEARAPRRWWRRLRMAVVRLAARWRGSRDGRRAGSVRLVRGDGGADGPNGRDRRSRRN